MKYLLLLASDPAVGPQTDEELAAEMPKWAALTEEMAKAGVLQGGEALQPPATATTIQVRNGERVISDGPYAETKEVLGGFYLIETDNLDEALEWAAKIPSAIYGSVEVRPVWDIPTT